MLKINQSMFGISIPHIPLPFIGGGKFIPIDAAPSMPRHPKYPITIMPVTDPKKEYISPHKTEKEKLSSQQMLLLAGAGVGLAYLFLKN